MAQFVKPRKIGVSALKNSILNTALTTHYECWFNPPASVQNLIADVEKDENYTLSCLEAALPGTSLATVELQNDHSGITERHVHRRQYDTTASFTFYVDRYYRQIQLFETWIGYIVNEQNSQSLRNLPWTQRTLWGAFKDEFQHCFGPIASSSLAP